MNKIPNPSYHSICSPMATSQEEEEADTASESDTMAQNKLLHSCSLETFFQGLRGLLFLPWGNDWDCIFPIPLQLIQPHLSSLLASLSSLVISASSSIFIFQLNQTYLLALLWLIQFWQLINMTHLMSCYFNTENFWEGALNKIFTTENFIRN